MDTLENRPKMEGDKGHTTFDNSGRRLVGMTAIASGPVDQDKLGDYATADREGRMGFVEGKRHPDDKGVKTNEIADSMEMSHNNI